MNDLVQGSRSDPLAFHPPLIRLQHAAPSPMGRRVLWLLLGLVLFLIVPMTYRLLTDAKAHTLVSVVVSFGAASAAYGIFQYAILHYDTTLSAPPF